MSTPTIPISAASQRVLQELVEQTGQTTTEILDRALDDYRRKVSLPAAGNNSASQATPQGNAALLARAWEAFSHDLDTLLEKHRGQWVAYHGATRVCTAESSTAAYQECKRRGLATEELFVEFVHPAALEEPEVCLSPTLEFLEEES